MLIQMQRGRYEKVKYSARDMVDHDLAHQRFERIALGLNLRLKSSGLTEGLVPVRATKVSPYDLKQTCQILSEKHTDQIGGAPHQPVRDSSVPLLLPSPCPHRGGVVPNP